MERDREGGRWEEEESSASSTTMVALEASGQYTSGRWGSALWVPSEHQGKRCRSKREAVSRGVGILGGGVEVVSWENLD